MGVQMDDEGMDVEDLLRVLGKQRSAGLPLPRVLYTVPTGQNPTGVTMTQERKAALYAVSVSVDRHAAEAMSDARVGVWRWITKTHHLVVTCTPQAWVSPVVSKILQVVSKSIRRQPADAVNLACHGTTV